MIRDVRNIVCFVAWPCVAMLCSPSHATSQGAISAVVASPGSKTVNIVITGTGDDAESWCGLRLEYGDGNGLDIKVERKEPLPKRMQYTFAKAGTYVLTVAGKRVTTHMPCPMTAQTTVQLVDAVAVAPMMPAVPVAPTASATPTVQARLGTLSGCPRQVTVKTPSGQDIPFNLHDFVTESGGLANAKEQVSRKIIESQSKALDDKLPASDRNAAKSYAQSLMQVRDQLDSCK